MTGRRSTFRVEKLKEASIFREHFPKIWPLFEALHLPCQTYGIADNMFYPLQILQGNKSEKQMRMFLFDINICHPPENANLHQNWSSQQDITWLLFPVPNFKDNMISQFQYVVEIRANAYMFGGQSWLYTGIAQGYIALHTCCLAMLTAYWAFLYTVNVNSLLVPESSSATPESLTCASITIHSNVYQTIYAVQGPSFQHHRRDSLLDFFSSLCDEKPKSMQILLLLYIYPSPII